jgi:hypothetical protein
MDEVKPFTRKPKPCDTCEAREATELRGFGGVMGAFFVCDECDTPPIWAVRVNRKGVEA